VRIQGHRGSIDDRLRCRARIADQRPLDLGDRRGRADRIATGQDEPFHLKRHYAVRQIDVRLAAERRPRLTAPGDAGDRRGHGGVSTDHVARLDYSNDRLPAHTVLVAITVGPAPRRKHGQKQRAAKHSADDRLHGMSPKVSLLALCTAFFGSAPVFFVF